VLGAGKWRDEYGETLRGKDVVIFSDVDDDPDEKKREQKREKVRRHVETMIASLTGKAKSIRLVVLPDGFKDISDYIEFLRPGSVGLGESVRQPVANLIERALAPDLWNGRVTVKAEREELPPPPPPCIQPPLNLLPPMLQEYIHAAAESLNVDVGFTLLPLLSCLGTAIGNSRSIILKPGFIQPSNIWTGIISPTGTLKSPSIEEACFAMVEHEKELDQQNKVVQEIYANDLATWESQKKSLRGPKPKPPVIKTCMMDDLTLEALADRLQDNPRGVLVAKDEISHWFESFDLYRNSKGADVSRWLSLHTGAHFGIDRRTDNRHQRIWLPRVCITGGVQPKVFKRLMREDYFERGLPARFIFAAPPFSQLKWSDATIPEKLRGKVRELFEKLWLLEPGYGGHGPFSVLLPLTKEALEIYIAFYNQCGVSAVESDEYEAGAWCKLPGHAARFALIGQLTCNPSAEEVSGEVMQAACDLSRWSGKETARIYAQLAETPEQREMRELSEFVTRVGGAATVRDTKRGCWRFRNKSSEEIERRYERMRKAQLGEWQPVPTTPKGGQPTRKFVLFQASTQPGNRHVISQTLYASTSTQPSGFTRGNRVGSVDVDVPTTLETTGSSSVDKDDSTSPDVEPAGISVPLVITRQMETELLRCGLTPGRDRQAHSATGTRDSGTPAAPVAGVVVDERGIGEL
jgi:hypothetical protein